MVWLNSMTAKMDIRYKRLCPGASAPFRAHGGDAGYDLTAVSRHIDADGSMVYGTGLAVEIPRGYVGLLFPRSSLSHNDLTVANAVGVIDSGYRGEVTVKFRPSYSFSDMMNERYAFSEVGGNTHRVYEVGERCCQLVILRLPEVEFVESDELGDGDRKDNGYGSSGRWGLQHRDFGRQYD